jgi:signal transduction histidine kinase
VHPFLAVLRQIFFFLNHFSFSVHILVEFDLFLFFEFVYRDFCSSLPFFLLLRFTFFLSFFLLTLLFLELVSCNNISDYLFIWIIFFSHSSSLQFLLFSFFLLSFHPNPLFFLLLLPPYTIYFHLITSILLISNRNIPPTAPALLVFFISTV